MATLGAKQIIILFAMATLGAPSYSKERWLRVAFLITKTTLGADDQALKIKGYSESNTMYS